MDFRFSDEDMAFGREVAEFVDGELPWDWRTYHIEPEDSEDRLLMRRFQKKLAERGWLTLGWPEEYGGQGASHIRQMVFNEETAYRGVPAVEGMVAPILMTYGTDYQKEYFLPSIARAEVTWCQGYSEPDSGSDLASLQTRAVEDGDDFVVTGSKIWNGAHAGAEWMFMLVRTDPDAPKHRGISFLLMEMDGPGITIKPVPMMWGASRALVTFDGVRVPKRNLVGELNRGWYVGAESLDIERSGIGVPARGRRLLDELVWFCKDTVRNGRPLAEDPVIRSRLANMAVELETSRLICYNVGWMQSQGVTPNKEASIAKLFSSEVTVRLLGLAMQLLGPYGQLEPGSKWAPLHGRVENGYMRLAFGAIGAGTVGAGTSEIQRNIIATRGLGLPRG